MNYIEKRNIWLLCASCLLATLFMNAATYSHDIPTPADVQSGDGSPVVLVIHVDVYDDEGNFLTHIHDYQTSTYTQEEVDEIHENNPHTKQSVIDNLPKEGDTKGVTQRSYDNPGFQPPDNLDNVGKPDPEGTYENYGVVSTPRSPEDSQDSQDNQDSQDDQDNQDSQDSQDNQGSRDDSTPLGNQGQTITATYNGETRTFEEITEPESSEDEEVYGITVVDGESVATPAQEITDSSQYSGTWYRLLSSAATRRNASLARQLDVVVTEYMLQTAGSRLPQWIEIHNTSERSVSLRGWQMSVWSHKDRERVITFSGWVHIPAKGFLILVNRSLEADNFGDINPKRVKVHPLRELRKSSWIKRFRLYDAQGILIVNGDQYDPERPQLVKGVRYSYDAVNKKVIKWHKNKAWIGSPDDRSTLGWHHLPEDVSASPRRIKKKTLPWASLKRLDK